MADSFLFYKSWLDIICENIEDRNIQNEMIRAIVEYGIVGTKTFPSERMFMQQTFAQIDSAQDKHIKRMEAGRKGGKAGTGGSKSREGNKNASKRKQTQANENVNSNVNVNENENEHSSGHSLGEKPLECNINYEDIDFDDE